jgi:choline-sulfatase
MAQPPNFLIIMADQWQAGALSCAGHPLVQTPYLDNLANQGVRFSNAFTPCPLCTPARTSFYSGLYPHAHGALVNEIGPRQDVRLLQDYLGQAGYRRGYAGKWHIGSYDSRAWDFDWVVNAHQDYYDFLAKQSLSWNKAEIFGVMSSPEQPHHGRLPFGVEFFRPRFLVDFTISFLEETAREQQPFLAICSFYGPHAPYVIPEPYYSMYPPEDITLPESFYRDDPDRPDALRRWQPGKYSRDWPEAKWRQVAAAYLGYISLIDAEIGRLLHHLDSLGLSRDTLVLFVSDHGEMNGAHRYLYKGPYFFEEVLRVPFILRYPPLIQAAQVNPALVSLLDVMPTVLELAGLPVPEPGHGHSLLPLLSGAAEPHRSSVYAELYDFAYGAAPLWCPLRCYHEQHWKFIERLPPGPEGEELYDLASDPHELHNLAQNPAFRPQRDRLWQALRRAAAEVNDPWPDVPHSAPEGMSGYAIQK